MKKQEICIHNKAVYPEMGAVCNLRKPNSICDECESFESKHTMQKEFVPYKETLILQKLGLNFDGFYLMPFGHYSQTKCSLPIDGHGFFNQIEIGSILTEENMRYLGCITKNFKSIPAPLWQQAFDFFESKYGLHITFVPRSWDTNEIRWSFWCDELKSRFGFHIDLAEYTGDGDKQDDPYKSLLETKLAAIRGLSKFVKSKPYKNIS